MGATPLPRVLVPLGPVREEVLERSLRGRRSLLPSRRRAAHAAAVALAELRRRELLIYDAALEAGHDPAEAARRSEERYWPWHEPCPSEEARAACSPFRLPRDPGKPSTR